MHAAERSTTPLQALNLLNDPLFMRAAQALAARILHDQPASVSDRIDYAFRLCLARSPSGLERERLLRYYESQQVTAEAAVWVGLSSILLNLEEFITRP